VVSGSELHELETLMERVLANPSGFAERVLQQLMDRLDMARPDGPVTVVGYDADAQQELSDHNLLLAAALGACDCWGTHVDCEVCAGAGTPGWTEPDPDLYAEYVTPAVNRATSNSPAARAAPTDTQEPDERVTRPELAAADQGGTP